MNILFMFSRPKIVLVLHGTDDQKEIVCKEKSDLADYYKPHSPGKYYVKSSPVNVMCPVILVSIMWKVVQ